MRGGFIERCGKGFPGILSPILDIIPGVLTGHFQFNNFLLSYLWGASAVPRVFFQIINRPTARYCSRPIQVYPMPVADLRLQFSGLNPQLSDLIQNPYGFTAGQLEMVLG